MVMSLSQTADYKVEVYLFVKSHTDSELADYNSEKEGISWYNFMGCLKSIREIVNLKDHEIEYLLLSTINTLENGNEKLQGG